MMQKSHLDCKVLGEQSNQAWFINRWSVCEESPTNQYTHKYNLSKYSKALLENKIIVA